MELGGLTGTIRHPPKAMVAQATTQFHWKDPNLSTEGSRGKKNHLLAARGSRFEPQSDQLSHHCLRPPKWALCKRALVGLQATTQFHWKDPNLSTEGSRGKKKHLLAARGSRFEPQPDQLSHHCLRPPKWALCKRALVGLIAPLWIEKKSVGHFPTFSIQSIIDPVCGTKYVSPEKKPSSLTIDEVKHLETNQFSDE